MVTDYKCPIRSDKLLKKHVKLRYFDFKLGRHVIISHIGKYSLRLINVFKEKFNFKFHLLRSLIPMDFIILYDLYDVSSINIITDITNYNQIFFQIK